MKLCRFCAEEIQDAAVVCKHCGRELSAAAESRLDSEVGRMLSAGQKIEAIKRVREEKSMGLAEAKAYVEAFRPPIGSAFPPVKKKSHFGFGCLMVVLLVTGIPFALALPRIIGTLTGERAKLQAEATRSVEAALVTARLPAAQSIEITGGYLVVTFEIDDEALSLMADAGISSPKEFASKAVITVRNAELPFDLVDSYRVTLKGPPPGEGLITLYGSARFTEGTYVTWEPGLGR